LILGWVILWAMVMNTEIFRFQTQVRSLLLGPSNAFSIAIFFFQKLFFRLWSEIFRPHKFSFRFWFLILICKKTDAYSGTHNIENFSYFRWLKFNHWTCDQIHLQRDPTLFKLVKTICWKTDFKTEQFQMGMKEFYYKISWHVPRVCIHFQLKNALSTLSKFIF